MAKMMIGDPVRIIDTHDALQAVRDRKSFIRWINDKDGVAALTVLTDGPGGDDPGIYYNLQPDEVAFISRFCYQLTTISDNLRIEWGYTNQPNGAGIFTPISPIFREQNGANLFRVAQVQALQPPASGVRYTNGARSITIRVQTNDAAARFMAYYVGWSEWDLP